MWGYPEGPKLPSPTTALASHLPPRSPSWGRILASATLLSSWFSQPQAEGVPWTKLYFLPSPTPGSEGAYRCCKEQTSRSRVQMSRCFSTEHPQAPVLLDSRSQVSSASTG